VYILVRDQVAVAQLLPACGEVIGRQIVFTLIQMLETPPGESWSLSETKAS
jgi:hypothetical protein